ncbi:SDR family oxidoreductase [Caenispirillum salinarum]|uniref:SDR family oxidoreductase n=1 Tax=Caenispirillum salinarum TaxID=859058 RepID=UPI00385085BE
MTAPHTAPVVVITGGSAGVGRACSEAFARDGWDVAILARGEDRLEDTKDAVEALGRRALAVSCDVADAEAVLDAADRVESELGPIDCWVNDAMATEFAAIVDTTPAEFQRVVDVTLMGQVHGVMAALKHMRRRGSGSIILVGSALAYRGIPLQAPYCAAKHAVRGFADSLRAELLHEDSAIRITEVHLPGLNTPQFSWARARTEGEPRPVPPVYQPEAAARAILRAAHERPRELWVGRATAKIILGAMLAPAYLDRMMAEQVVAQQQSRAPHGDRPDNLHSPAPGPYAAHGRFDDEAEEWAAVIDPDRIRRTAGFALGAVAVGAAALGLARALKANGRQRQRQRWGRGGLLRLW